MDSFLPVLRERPTDLKKLRGKHRIIIQMHVAGLDNTTIAETVGLSYNQVCNVLKSPLARQHISVLCNVADLDAIDMQRSFSQYAAVAFEYATDLIESTGTPSHVRANLIKDVLDRAGYSPVRRMETINRVLTEVQIQNMRENSLEEAKAAGLVVEDAEFEDLQTDREK